MQRNETRYRQAQCTSHLPYSYDPREREAIVHYEWFAGERATLTCPGFDQHIEINAVMLDSADIWPDIRAVKHLHDGICDDVWTDIERWRERVAAAREASEEAAADARPKPRRGHK